jgi:hypothetical protein
LSLSGTWPADGSVYPAIRELPIMFFDPEKEGGVIQVAGFICFPIKE